MHPAFRYQLDSKLVNPDGTTFQAITRLQFQFFVNDIPNEKGEMWFVFYDPGANGFVELRSADRNHSIEIPADLR